MRKLLAHNDIEVNKAEAFHGYTPLDVVCQNNQPDILEMLLQHKDICVNASSIQSTTPLWSACWLGHANIVKLLLSHAEIEVNLTECRG